MLELHLMNIRLRKISLPSKFLLAVYKFSAIEKSLSDGADVALGPKYSFAKAETVASYDFFFQYIMEL